MFVFSDYRRHLNRLLDSDPSSYDSTDSDFSVSRLNPNRERTRRQNNAFNHQINNELDFLLKGGRCLRHQEGEYG